MIFLKSKTRQNIREEGMFETKKKYARELWESKHNIGKQLTLVFPILLQYPFANSLRCYNGAERCNFDEGLKKLIDEQILQNKIIK